MTFANVMKKKTLLSAVADEFSSRGLVGCGARMKMSTGLGYLGHELEGAEFGPSLQDGTALDQPSLSTLNRHGA